MKTITKTFYTDRYDLENYTCFTVSKNKTPRQDYEIQISWQEPEKKIEITESEFEKVWDESLTNHSMRTEIRFSKEFYNFKQKLFGKGE